MYSVILFNLRIPFEIFWKILNLNFYQIFHLHDFSGSSLCIEEVDTVQPSYASL
ncbi:hypothetical protein EV06_0327 [Prochlorococcus sp. MIT 0602]|nr:hypothetical protein EV06_0327 [Prochlorococcus sp. MIT 0602]KGG17037.1 hypothetical protein EV07_0466 [Prochlorococcus sp. MIT 0603]